MEASAQTFLQSDDQNYFITNDMFIVSFFFGVTTVLHCYTSILLMMKVLMMDKINYLIQVVCYFDQAAI